MPSSPRRERTISGRSSGKGSRRGSRARSSLVPTRQAAVSGSSAVSSSRKARASTGRLLVVRRRRVILLGFSERVLQSLLRQLRVRGDERVADQERDPPTIPREIRSMPCNDSGTRAPTTNWAQNNPNRYPASRRLSERFDRIATAKKDWAAVRNSSSRCTSLIGRPWVDALEIANTTGSVPTRSVHWLTFEDT